MISFLGSFFLFKWLQPSKPKIEKYGVEISKPASDASLPVIYGKRKVPGTIVFKGTSDADDDDTPNDLLHIIIVWGESVSSIDDLYLDDYSILDSRFDGDGGRWAYVQHFPSGMGQYSDPGLKTAGWDANEYQHRLDDCACSYVRLEFSGGEDAPIRSEPNLTALISGRKISSFLGGSARFSSNPAEVLFDYLTNKKYGKGLSETQLDINSFTESALFCDSLVPKFYGSNEKKKIFTCNTVIDTAKPLRENVNDLLEGMRGLLPVINGKLTLVIERDEPATIDGIDIDIIRGDLKDSETGKSNRYNRVIVEFDDAEQKFSSQQAAYPDAGSDIESKWLAEDNDVLLEYRVKISTLTDYYEARQMARVIAMLSRDSIVVDIEVAPIALQFTVGDIIPLSHPKRGWEGKPFRLVKSRALEDGWFKLTLHEHNPYIYNWLSAGKREPLPDTTLPNPKKMAAPSDFSISADDAGKAIIRWRSGAAYFTAQLIRNDEHVRTDTVVTNMYELPDLSSGSYELDVCAHSPLGYRSDFSTFKFNIVQPAPPIVSVSSKTHETVNFSARLKTESFSVNFEWKLAEFESVSTGSNFALAGLSPSSKYTVLCRAKTPAGYSEWAEYEVTTLAAPERPLLTSIKMELSQSPTWTVIGSVFLPEKLVNEVKITAFNTETKDVLFTKSTSVKAEMETGFLDLVSESGDSEIELKVEGQGTSSLSLTAYCQGHIDSRAFTVIGNYINDFNELSDSVAEIDALSDTVLKQALASESNFDAELQSTLKLESKTDRTNASLKEFSTAQASKDEAMANKITLLSSSVNDNKAGIVEVSQTLAKTNEATSARLLKLSSEVENNHAEIKNNFITKVDSQSAISQATTSLTSKMDVGFSHFESNYHTSATVDEIVSSSAAALSAEIEGGLKATSEQINLVKAEGEQRSLSITKLEKSAAALDGRVTANLNSINGVSASVNGHSRSINYLTQRVSNNESGVSGLHADLSRVESKADGAVDSVRQISTEVSNVKGSVSRAFIDLSSHQNQINSLYSRVSIGVDWNGNATGLSITPGKFHIQTSEFQLKDSSGAAALHFDSGARQFKFKGHIEASSSNLTLGSNSKIGTSADHLRFYWGSTQKAWISGYGNASFRDVTTKYLRVNSDDSRYVYTTRFSGVNVGCQASGAKYAFYAMKGAIGPHTSAHEGLMTHAELSEISPGDIVCDERLVHIADVSNAICTSRLSSKRLDKAVRGVYTGHRRLEEFQPAGLQGLEDWEQLGHAYSLIQFNAGGEGVINVSGEGGDISINDYICASSTKGKGMKMPADLSSQYAVAQARHPVSFESPDQIKKVAVIYIRG